jgi:hypothetical protein
MVNRRSECSHFAASSDGAHPRTHELLAHYFQEANQASDGSLWDGKGSAWESTNQIDQTTIPEINLERKPTCATHWQ